MALDGITVCALARELNEELAGARISKITQTESDELYITAKPAGDKKQVRLLLSASAALPLAYLTTANKAGPMTAPAFCMLLRKHLMSGRVVSVTQPDFERILRFRVRGTDEMGDLKDHVLVIELMGKHSNIILLDDSENVIDSIRRVPASVSSVREVLPGRSYFVPAQEKESPLSADRRSLALAIRGLGMPLFKAVYTSYMGVSPIMAQEICYRAGIDADRSAISLTDEEFERFADAFLDMFMMVEKGEFSPEIVYKDGAPLEFAALELTLYGRTSGTAVRKCTSMSTALEEYYSEKNEHERMRQRSYDLRKLVGGMLDRDRKKYALQQKQLADTEKKDRLRLCGELLQAYGYQVEQGAKKVTLEDYNTGKPVEVVLDPELSAHENAGKYFERYQKLKRTALALDEQIARTREDIEHLESVGEAISIAKTEGDLREIREELVLSGYVKKTGTKTKERREEKSEPLHYVTPGGYDIYVGKNNLQNDRLTFRFAEGADWWFHAKKMPGSHVILKIKKGQEVPDREFELAAAAAAWYSSGREQNLVEVDYVIRKEVKKPAGSKPGFVVYYTNYSMAIKPGIAELTEVTSG
ncbi:MAG: NFACT family protein [Lachnospiraceae bacterium]|nr:NFACT family protein [Lachnospiraceae bacterium]